MHRIDSSQFIFRKMKGLNYPQALKKGGDPMEIIRDAAEELNEIDALNCCWPPGTFNWEAPEADN